MRAAACGDPALRFHRSTHDLHPILPDSALTNTSVCVCVCVCVCERERGLVRTCRQTRVMSNPSVRVPNIHQYVQSEAKNQRVAASVTSRENAEGIRLNPRMKRVRRWFSVRAPRQTLCECVGSDACAVCFCAHTHTHTH